jgi:Chaperone of endosialidase
MDKSSEAILAFKPVTFQYKSDATDTPQFGLIAEEVASRARRLCLAQYYTEEASGLFRARISRPVSNGTVTVTPLVSRGRPGRPDRTKVV